MRKFERLAMIKEILIKQNKINVEALCDQFSVSPVTIRNDLNQLEKEGSIQRIYGGAVLKQPATQAFMPRCILRNELINFNVDKLYIAQIAKSFIHDGDCIFIGCGETCAAIAQALMDLRVNIVTNSIISAAILALNANPNVVITGGNLSGYDRHFLSGPEFERSIENIHVDWAFFGASGVDLNVGFSGSSTYERSVFENVRKVASKVVFALAAEKFGTASFASIAKLGAADYIISNSKVPDEYQNCFNQHGVKTITSLDGVS